MMQFRYSGRQINQAPQESATRRNDFGGEGKLTDEL